MLDRIAYWAGVGSVHLVVYISSTTIWSKVSGVVVRVARKYSNIGKSEDQLQDEMFEAITDVSNSHLKNLKIY